MEQTNCFIVYSSKQENSSVHMYDIKKRKKTITATSVWRCDTAFPEYVLSRPAAIQIFPSSLASTIMAVSKINFFYSAINFSICKSKGLVKNRRNGIEIMFFLLIYLVFCHVVYMSRA